MAAIDRAQVEGLATGEFVRPTENLVIVGQSGVGKSFLLQAISRRFCELGDRIRYTTSAELLQLLAVDDTDFNDEGVQQLAALTDLRTLGLSDTKVTDAGLEHLKGLTNLTYLFLPGTQVTDEGVRDLQQALPNCEIHH